MNTCPCKPCTRIREINAQIDARIETDRATDRCDCGEPKPSIGSQLDHPSDTTTEDTVTITISRNCAEYFAERACTNDRACFTEVGGCVALDCHLEQACLAALEGER